MKLQEAQEIVGYILDWQFLLMGGKERSDMPSKIDLSKYTLDDLIKANKMVKAHNKRKERLHDYHVSRGHKTKGFSVSLLLADRIIAAVYTCLNFSPNGEMIGLIDDVGCGCVIAEYKYSDKYPQS